MNLLELIRSDFLVDPRNPKGLLLCVMYRLAHSVTNWPKIAMPLGYILIAFYKIITEYIIGSEIHWRARIGPGLCVYHGYGLVVHSDVIIGSYCVLRHGVTIGSKLSNGRLVAPILGDHVDVGAGALIIGGYRVGDSVRVGAGTVVVDDIPSRATVVGNPGRILARAVQT